MPATFVGLALAAVLSAAAAQPVKSNVPGIVNFTRIDATFACAGATEAAALAELARQGFRSVVNFRLPTEEGADIDASRAEAERLGLRYFHLPFDSRQPDPSVPDRFLQIVTDPANQPVFIHCSRGIRAAAMWMVKRVVVDGWTVADAEQEARLIGLVETSPAWNFVHEYLKKRQGGP
jgi:uncharacterized protein (TIGR01244 family)